MALFFKIIPDVTLATQQRANKKNNKAQITINITYNIIILHKLDLWFISKVIKVQYFSYLLINIKNSCMV